MEKKKNPITTTATSTTVTFFKEQAKCKHKW